MLPICRLHRETPCHVTNERRLDFLLGGKHGAAIGIILLQQLGCWIDQLRAVGLILNV